MMNDFMSMLQNPYMLMGMNLLRAGGRGMSTGTGLGQAGLETLEGGLKLDQVKTLQELRKLQADSYRQANEEQQKKQQMLELLSKSFTPGMTPNPENRAGMAQKIAALGDVETALRVAFPSELETQGNVAAITHPLLGVLNVGSAGRGGAGGGGGGGYSDMINAALATGEEAPAEPEDTGPGTGSRLMSFLRVGEQPTARSNVTQETEAPSTAPAAVPAAAPAEGGRTFRNLIESLGSAMRGSDPRVVQGQTVTAGYAGLSPSQKAEVDRGISDRKTGEAWVRKHWKTLSAEQRAYALKRLGAD